MERGAAWEAALLGKGNAFSHPTLSHLVVVA